MKKDFTAAADGKSNWKREALPDPSKVAEAGIKTRESLAWQAAQHPAPPTLTHEIDQESVRQDTIEAVRDEQRRNAIRMREEFEGRPDKARRDFRTAHDYRGFEQER